MATHRQPIQRKRHIPEFTPETISAFADLRKVYENGECTCPRPTTRPPPRFSEGSRRCQACQEYSKAEGAVIGLLKLRPWQILENPYFKNPYPVGCPTWQALEDRKKLEHEARGGFALWWRLEAAAGLQPLHVGSDDEDDERR